MLRMSCIGGQALTSETHAGVHSLKVCGYGMQRLAATGSQGRAGAAARQHDAVEQPAERAARLRARHQRPACGDQRIRPDGLHLRQVLALPSITAVHFS